MKAIRFLEQNAIVGMDQGAHYSPLPVMFTKTEKDEPSMKTVWAPDEEERKLLGEGHFIVVEILGQQHPPIRLGVSTGKVEL